MNRWRNRISRDDEKSNGNYLSLGKRLGSNVSYEHIRVRHSDTDRTSPLVETLIETGETKQPRGESIRGREREGRVEGKRRRTIDLNPTLTFSSTPFEFFTAPSWRRFNSVHCVEDGNKPDSLFNKRPQIFRG